MNKRSSSLDVEDVLLNVIQFIGNVKTLKNARLVSKTWEKVASPQFFRIFTLKMNSSLELQLRSSKNSILDKIENIFILMRKTTIEKKKGKEQFGREVADVLKKAIHLHSLKILFSGLDKDERIENRSGNELVTRWKNEDIVCDALIERMQTLYELDINACGMIKTQLKWNRDDIWKRSSSLHSLSLCGLNIG